MSKITYKTKTCDMAHITNFCVKKISDVLKITDLSKMTDRSKITAQINSGELKPFLKPRSRANGEEVQAYTRKLHFNVIYPKTVKN